MSRQGSYKFIFVPKKLTFRDNAFIVQYNKITFTKVKSGLFFDDKPQYFLYLKKKQHLQFVALVEKDTCSIITQILLTDFSSLLCILSWLCQLLQSTSF